MSFLRKLFGLQRTSSVQEILVAMKAFTEAALLLVPPSDYERDETKQKRVFVFLFGALDALVQSRNITGQDKFDTLHAYLQETFPAMTSGDIQQTIIFLGDASSNPSWTPIMQRGGQTMVDWSRGDTSSPSRLLKVAHYGMDDF